LPDHCPGSDADVAVFLDQVADYTLDAIAGDRPGQDPETVTSFVDRVAQEILGSDRSLGRSTRPAPNLPMYLGCIEQALRGESPAQESARLGSVVGQSLSALRADREYRRLQRHGRSRSALEAEG
jgi:hypothetical protein